MKSRIVFGIIAVAAMAVSVPVSAGPVVAGFERLKEATPAERGEILLGELNCLSCHTARSAISDRVGTKLAPNLGNAGERLTPGYLRAFLNDVHGVKPGTTMPDLFHASEGSAKAGAIDYLVHFLVSKGGPIKASKTAVNPAAIEMGRELFHSVGCVACHAPEKAEGITTPIIPLPANLASKTTVEMLAEFLKNPLHVRPSGRMPSLSLSDRDARAIAAYLLRGQAENTNTKGADNVPVEGWAYEYYELSDGQKKLPVFSKIAPAAKGITRQIGLNPDGLKRRGHHFALRFKAQIRIPKDGKYRFWFASDDGSRLIFDDKVVGENDGIHPNNEKRVELELKRGVYPIELQYFEFAGEVALSLEASGPGFGKKRGPIETNLVSAEDQRPMVPLGWEEFAVDAQKVRMGQMMFAAIGCAACHNVDDIRPMRPAPVLSELKLDSASGCLGETPRRQVPHYRLSAEQRASIKAALGDQGALAKPLAPEERVKRTMATLNCYACHQRDGLGGPDDVRAEGFTTNIPVDLGEEGKIPPTLTGVGEKLKKEAMQSILYDGKLHIRYFMSARMPLFGRDNVSGLIDDLVTIDRKAPAKAPEFSEESMEVGKRLIGQTGLFCINCHLVNGGRGPGIPGVDLGMVHKRINPDWFHKFLLNPPAYNKGTRMPAFWPDGQSALPTVLGGDAGKQIAAIWNYLSLGDSMPFPLGIQPADGVGMELTPLDRPIIHRTFMTDVGPRSILAGFPERVHVAFDANVVRLAKAWRGRFFDGSGVASGRTDTFNGPLGKDVVDMPAGPAFAVLASQSDPWPTAGMTDRNIGGSFKGYRLDPAGRPTFRYELAGALVEEQVQPVLRPGGANVVRKFKVTARSDVKNLYLLAGEGKSVDHTSTRDWIIDASMNVIIDGDGAGQAVTREEGDRQQLLVPVQFTNGRAEFSITLDW